MENRPDPDTILQRFDVAIAASGRSVADIEAAAGLNRDRLRDFLKGRKTGLAFLDAALVAAEIGVSIAWLAGLDPAAPSPDCRGARIGEAAQ